MDKYEKLFKGLEMCAGPECCTECPYHGGTLGGKTCRARLLDDAAFALATEESRAVALASECEALRTAKNELDVELYRTQQREAALLNGEAGSPVKSPDDARPAFDDTRPAKPKEPDNDLAEAMELALKATSNAEYWRGQADALKWCCRFYFGDEAKPEPEATGDV